MEMSLFLKKKIKFRHQVTIQNIIEYRLVHENKRPVLPSILLAGTNPHILNLFITHFLFSFLVFLDGLLPLLHTLPNELQGHPYDKFSHLFRLVIITACF